MSEIPADLRVKLEERVREQIASEVSGNVAALYEFTLPAIRARRVNGRDDEPELSLSEIRQFVALIHEAEVQSVEVEQFHETVERFSGSPAAVVVTTVRYNQRSEDSQFRCIWVYSAGTWFSTALGKLRFGSPPNPRSSAEPGGAADGGGM
jgi:hypothetical protein